MNGNDPLTLIYETSSKIFQIRINSKYETIILMAMTKDYTQCTERECRHINNTILEYKELMRVDSFVINLTFLLQYL